MLHIFSSFNIVDGVVIDYVLGGSGEEDGQLVAGNERTAILHQSALIITTFLTEFIDLFPDASVIPKMHYMVHIPRLILMALY